MIRIEIDGIKETGTRLSSIAERLLNFTPAFKKARRTLIRDFYRRRFSSEGAFGGGRRWAPLSVRYAREKLRSVGQKPILQRTGELYDSLTADSHPLQVEHIYPKRYTFGTRAKSARFHQRGTNNMPQRIILPNENQGFRRDVADLIRAFVMKGTK